MHNIVVPPSIRKDRVFTREGWGHDRHDLSSEVGQRKKTVDTLLLSVRMKDLYMYLSSRDCLDLYQLNTPSECWIQLPKLCTLEGRWECGLIDITLDCDFTPRSSRLYLCTDFVEDSYVRGSSFPILKNIEIAGRYKKVKFDSFPHPTYVPVKTTQFNTLKLRLVDENLKPVVFKSNDLHCVLHFRQQWAP